MLRVVLWTLVAVVAIDLITIVLRISRWRAVVFLQSVTPLVALVGVGVTATAMFLGDALLLLASAVGSMSLFVLIFASWQSQRDPVGNDVPSELRVAHANLLHSNPAPARAVHDTLSCAADVIAFSEITVELHGHALDHPRSHDWPHRLHDLQDGPRGIALWSKYPFAEGRIERLHDCHAAVATIRTPSGSEIRVLAIHPMAPVSRRKLRDWAPSLERIGLALTASDLPGVAIGDYNATHWHPPMRRLYRAGLANAHLRRGRIFASTFPVGRRLQPFIGLDHALVTADIAVHDVTHLDVTGSDHRGIVVDLSIRSTSSPGRFKSKDRHRSGRD
ncbi:MAG: endonuclease/exonuclease/phosphatase family protein [Actinomycetota bacterium]